MGAIEKIETLSIKVVHAECERDRPGLALETVYRWRAALKGGRGVADDIKVLLIGATSRTPHQITWADFAPPRVASPSESLQETETANGGLQ